MKKFLSLIVVLALVMAIMPTALAATTHNVSTAAELVELLDNDGTGDIADGDTIMLQGNIAFNSSNAGSNKDGWIDGIKYTGDQSFTINLNGYTISCDSTLNDYLLYFNNLGAKANEITLINGTIEGGDYLWAVICVSASSTKNNTTVNLGDGLTVTGGGGGNSGEDTVVKVRYKGIVNVLSGAKIVSVNAMYCIQGGVNADDKTATVNIYEGAAIQMSMAGGAAVSGTANVNIYGGVISSKGWGVYTCTSGTPNFVISGGSIAGDSGAVASAADWNNYPDAAPSVSITGGSIVGAVAVHEYGTTTSAVDAELAVSGGAFVSETVNDYLVEGVLAATVTMTDNGSAMYAVGEESIQACAEFAADAGGATVTITSAGANAALMLPAGTQVNNETDSEVAVNGYLVGAGDKNVKAPEIVGEETESSVFQGPVVPFVVYEGGNEFSLYPAKGPVAVAINNVQVSFSFVGNTLVVDGIPGNGNNLITLYWADCTNTIAFEATGIVPVATPDAGIELPQTGDASMTLVGAVVAFAAVCVAAALRRKVK